MSFSGRANAAFQGDERTGVSFAGRAALVVRLALGDNAELRLEAGPGVNFHAVTASDDGSEVSGVQGVLAQAGLGFGAVF